MPRPSRMHLPSPNSVNFNLHAPKESRGCPRPPLLTPAPSCPHPAPPAPSRARPRSRRPWRRAPAEPLLPPHGARRADWVPAPPERGSGSGAALIGCGAGSTPSSCRAAAAPALTERDAGCGSGRERVGMGRTARERGTLGWRNALCAESGLLIGFSWCSLSKAQARKS